MSRRATVLLATGALVAVTAIWGATFALVKEAIVEVPPYEFLAIRFVMAAVVLAAIFPSQVRRMGREVLVAGALAGTALGSGYIFQTLGLQFTSATRAGFITGLFVVFTPPLSAVLLKRLPSATALAGVAGATGGLVLLTAGRLAGGFNQGDLLVVFCAVAFAAHVVLLGRYSPRHDPRALTVVQMTVIGAGCTLLAVANEDLVMPSGTGPWTALLITGLGASALAFLVQTWAQRHLAPTRTAVTLTMEPVFAGVAGYLLLSERLQPLAWVGALLILAAMVLVSVSHSEQQANAELSSF